MSLRMNLSEIQEVKQKAFKIERSINIFEDHLLDLYDFDKSVFFTQSQRGEAKKFYKKEIAKLSAEKKKVLARIKLEN